MKVKLVYVGEIGYGEEVIKLRTLFPAEDLALIEYWFVRVCVRSLALFSKL